MADGARLQKLGVTRGKAILIGVLALMIYSFVDSSVEQAVPRFVVPATLITFGITMWAGCRCAYSYGLRDGSAKPASVD